MPETVPCNLCCSNRVIEQAEKARFLNVEPPYQIVKCAHCGFIFQSPRPTRAELKRMYETHPYYAADNATRGASRLEFYEARFNRIETMGATTGYMLGIGCLEGGYALEVAAARGWRVTGIESSSILASHAQQQLGLEVCVADAWDLSGLQGSRYDLIYSHSLEHVPDARQTIRDCARLLRSGGALALEVPNQFYSLKDVLKSWVVGLAPSLNRHFYQEVVAGFHTYFFNPATLKRLLEEEGFRIVSLKTYLPRHPVYLHNPKGRWIQESVYALGGLLGRGPSIEVIATL